MVSFACLFHQSRSFLFSRDKYICQEILIKPEPDHVIVVPNQAPCQ